MRRASPFVVLAIALVGCSSESTPSDRSSSPTTGPSDGGADADALAPDEPDPNQGRDDDPASCYAACSNPSFTCQAGTAITHASVTPDQEGKGCVGTLTEGKGTASEKSYAILLDCGKKQVCIGDTPGQPATACVSATFSATSFGYTPASGAQNVCTRD